MARLREIFEEMGLVDVATYIASGNVIFTAAGKDADSARLVERIETGLRTSLGYDVTTFLRTGDELVRVARHEPFPGKDAGKALSVAFLREAPDPATAERFLALRGERDDFEVRGREVYWLARDGISGSAAWAPLEKLLAGGGTMRNINTVRKIAERFFATPERDE